MNEPIDEVKARRQLKALRETWQHTLDADANAVSTDVAERLQAARASALSAAARRDTFVVRNRWWLAPAVAAVLVVAVWLPMRTLNTPAPEAFAPPEDIGEIAVWQEESELLDELDFYTWLEVEADHAS